MKISIERATLLKAVAQAQSVVERRNTIPILSNVMLAAKGGVLHLTASDLDRGDTLLFERRLYACGNR